MFQRARTPGRYSWMWLACAVAVGVSQPLVCLSENTPAAPESNTTTGRKPVDFGRDIRPILSKNCFACHGPDADHQKAGLRLDRRESALAKLESGQAAIVPGKLDESALYERIISTEPEEVMPPPKSGLKLTPEQVELFKRWIAEGATYAQHWSLVKPRQAALPPVHRAGWAKNAIDYFVQAKLEHAGLTPNPEADRYALIRRVSLDLRGLPPTPAEVAEFVSSKQADAYERLVERYLADPAFGERWARVWLDQARYADSKGYGSDPLREIWKYRDWVIQAFNRNLPYDQFTIEQLAGDLLPHPTTDQLIATAFHRNTLTNTEGGTDDEEFRIMAVKDRVDTTLQVWMGLTMGCAKCHSHKFDPITLPEYYQTLAIFNQTADNDQPDESPTLPVPSPEIERKQQEIATQIAALRTRMESQGAQLSSAQQAWEQSVRGSVTWNRPQVISVNSPQGVIFRELPDGSLQADGKLPDQDEYTVVLRLPPQPINMLRLEVLPDPLYSQNGPGRGPEGEFLLSGIQVATRATTGKESSVPLRAVTADYSHPLHAVEQVLRPAAAAQRDGWGVMEKNKQPHAAVFAFESPVPSVAGQQLVVRLEQKSRRIQRLLGRFRLSVAQADRAVTRQPVPASLLRIVDEEPARRTPADRTRLEEYYRGIAPALKMLRDEIARLEKERPRSPTVPILRELAPEKQRITRIHVKGNFLVLGDVVQPALPASFHRPPPGKMDRLAVARWIVDRENPLTARVAVNRFWSQIFGAGIVETEEDFGSQGELPSHPELLDWMAVEFSAPSTAGAVPWDVKRLLRLIVTSATYRQGSHVSPEALRKDPRNRFYSRSPRFRLEAELVRDQALSLAGLLSRKMYGPSVFPPQPEGLWQAAFNGTDRSWVVSTGEDKYRRGIYVFWRRTVPYPSMATFDAPSRETCSIRRIRTNTPLQAFVTLNDPVYVEAAQALARRIIHEGGSTAGERARFALQLCLVRPPQPAELEAVLRLLHEERLHYAERQSEATLLGGNAKASVSPEESSPADLAAWTVVANVLLNHDGILSKN